MSTRKLAQSEQIKSHLSGAQTFWANLKNVGYGYENKRTDVMLIQFFLNAAFTYKRDTLVVDGLFGGKTWGAIKRFQTWMCGVDDGMVSAVSGSDLRSPKQHRIYTIYDLNMVYQDRFPHFFDDLKKDPLLPSALCSQFTVPEFWEYGDSPC